MEQPKFEEWELRQYEGSLSRAVAFPGQMFDIMSTESISREQFDHEYEPDYDTHTYVRRVPQIKDMQEMSGYDS
jgi:hypothetical protein